MKSLAKRVEAGAALLDREEPGWALRINLEKLNMDLPDYCILGQALGPGLLGVSGFDRGLRRFHLPTGVSYGFNLATTEGDAQWDELDRLWREEILKRRPSPEGP